MPGLATYSRCCSLAIRERANRAPSVKQCLSMRLIIASRKVAGRLGMNFDELIASGPLLADGAWGTQLQERGLAICGCAEEWNLSRPEAVAEVARSYVEAGSRVILTNTFRANRLALAEHGLDRYSRAINRAGAALSRQAALG